jgi:hypothetical protein
LFYRKKLILRLRRTGMKILTGGLTAVTKPDKGVEALVGVPQKPSNVTRRNNKEERPHRREVPKDE